MNTAGYLSLIKTRHSISSDYALSKLLGVSRQTVSNWVTGQRLPDALMCFRVAELAGVARDVVLADVELERAERAGNAPQAGAWREWVEKLGGIAAGVVLGAGLIGPAPSADAATARVSGQSGGDGLYIMSTRRRRRLATWLDALKPRLRLPDFTPAPAFA